VAIGGNKNQTKGFVFNTNYPYFYYMRYLILLSLLVCTFPVTAELYRWVDERGNVHFSDKPVKEGAKSYTPPPITTVPATSPGNYNFGSNKSGQAKPVKYESIEVTSPAHDHVFTPDKTDNIAVLTNLAPRLRAAEGHRFALYLNGTLYKEGGPSFNLVGLNRGTYAVYAAVLDKKGKVILKSKPISFHVQKHSL